ncbi:recombinase family protein [Nonomuraea sp. NPDC050451]|uniref:recombinase family protein n=1 Tax=Nonomuraea sp. NPDC050451 TaxID=3364364 RepID=UPI0037B0DF09
MTPTRAENSEKTPGGRLSFHIFAALAEFIRELIIAGTRDGLAAAKACGRPTVITPELLRAACSSFRPPLPERSCPHSAHSVPRTIRRSIRRPAASIAASACSGTMLAATQPIVGSSHPASCGSSRSVANIW